MSDEQTPITQPASATEQTVSEGDAQKDTHSVISSLKALRSQLGEGSKPLDLVIPGYDGLLLVRYKWVPFKELSKNAQNLKKITEQSDLQITASSDILITTCQEFLIKVGDLVKPLAEDGVPIQFGDGRLPEMLGFAVTQTAREAVRAVFANDYAMIRTANTVVDWLQDTTVQVDQELLGN